MPKIRKFLPCIAAVIVIAGIMFYAGMKYGEGQNSSSQNLNPNRQQSARRLGNNNGGFTAGKIISKDVNNITVQLNNGGSRIVFFSDSTKISKSATSTADELKTGEQILASGSPNSDGSITAQSIQLGISAPQRTQTTQGQ